MDPSEGLPSGNRSITDLLGDLIRDLNGLVVTEGRLLRAEIAEAGQAIASGTATIATGAALIVVAMLVLVQALIVFLAEWLGPAPAALMVGGALAVVGIVLLLRGRAALTLARLTPDRTVEQNRRDVRLAKEQL